MKLKFATIYTTVCLLAVLPWGAAAESASGLLGIELPGTDAISDALPGAESFTLPEWPDATTVLQEAMRHYEDVSKQIAQVQPQLDQLGFSISNFKTELLPPSVRMRLVSREGGTPSELIARPEDMSLLATAVLTSAETAKQVQAALGLEVVIMDVVVGGSPSIKLSYLKSADEAQLASQLQDINDSCVAAPQ